jgi:hypothetical protein
MNVIKPLAIAAVDHLSQRERKARCVEMVPDLAARIGGTGTSGPAREVSSAARSAGSAFPSKHGDSVNRSDFMLVLLFGTGHSFIKDASLDLLRRGALLNFFVRDRRCISLPPNKIDGRLI